MFLPGAFQASLAAHPPLSRAKLVRGHENVVAGLMLLAAYGVEIPLGRNLHILHSLEDRVRYEGSIQIFVLKLIITSENLPFTALEQNMLLPFSNSSSIRAPYYQHWLDEQNRGVSSSSVLALVDDAYGDDCDHGGDDRTTMGARNANASLLFRRRNCRRRRRTP